MSVMKKKYLSVAAIVLASTLLAATSAHAIPAVPSEPWTPPPAYCRVSTSNEGSFLLYTWHECAWWEAQIYWNNSISVRWFY
jgi:hypothetical protein